MRKSEALNTFDLGLVMDINPLVAPNDGVCNALNATLITMNGNENVLQNDMGNGRVETACLPEGYIPLGTALLGGIIYIVSYNPLSKKCLIGSFPSPERNITSDKFIGSSDKTINCSDFYIKEKKAVNGYKFISNPYLKLILTDLITLHPGDKFLIYSPEISEATTYISAFNLPDHNPDLLPKYLKFNVMAITDDGKMTNLNNKLVWLPLKNLGDYYIRNDNVDLNNYKDIDEYRNLIQSNYNVFQTKTSGKLGIVAELECISSFDISWDALKKGNNWEIYLYTNWTYNNDYSKNLINLFGIYYKSSGYKEEKEEVIVIRDYPINDGESDKESDTDIKNKNEVTFYNPPYISNIEEYLEGNKGKPTEPRNNDGTDNLFLISTPITVPSTSDKEAILDLSIMPLMPFGILLWMELNISINLSKLGTGSVDLVLYKYYVEDELVLLSWGLEAYPERNKSINNVTFNFYEINSDILTSIQNSGLKIDNNRFCKDTWQEYDETKQDWVNIEGTDLSLGSPVKSIINEGQSSYSGFFTEKFSKKDLIENYVYLVEISIDYNKEKTIKYYRIFYNSNIFNDYYYKDNYNDFKEIVLDNELLILYTLKMKTLIEENSTKFSEEVPLIFDEPLTKFLEYYIDHKILGYNTGVIDATVNDIFEAKIDEIILSSITPDLTNNALAEQISSLSKPSLIEIAEIVQSALIKNSKIEKNLITNEFNYELEIPLLITYNTKSLLNIPYELVHATCTYCWMIYRGRDKYHHLSLYPNITNIKEDDYYIARDSFKDNTNKEGIMRTTYTNCYNQLSLLLDIYDIVALPTMAVRGISGKGDRSVSIGFSLGSINNDNINRTTEISWSETLQDNSCGLFYAMKTQDDLVIVFSFDGTNIGMSFPTVKLEHDIECLKAKSKDICRITDETSYSDDEIPEYIHPLRGYYIPRKYTGSISKYLWTTLLYYPSFLETSSYDIKGKSYITLSINSGIKLTPNIAVNNLKYINERKFNVSYESSWEVPTSNLISTLTDLGSDVYAVLPDGTLSKDSIIGRNNVYDYKGNKISSIANWSSGYDIPVISEMNKSSNTMTLCVVDGRLRIKLNLVSSENTGSIAGKSENLSIRISQIPILPYF